MHYEEKLEGKTMFKGKIIDVVHDTVRLENGRQALREVITHPGAVGVLVAEGDSLVMVRQYRYAVGRELLEIPAGKLEAGEEPTLAALRELREETGIAGHRLVYLGDYYASPGILGEVIHLYFAHAGPAGAPNPDEDEFVTAQRITVAAFEDMLAKGQICDGKTISAYALARARGLV